MPISFFKHLADKASGQILKITPPDALKDLIEGFYICKASPSERRELFFNDGYPLVTFMGSQHETVEIQVDGGSAVVGSSWVCGGVLRNIYCESQFNFEDCLVIRFHPVTFFKFFGINENIFENKRVFDLCDIAGSGFKSFNEAFYSSSSNHEKVNLCISFFSEGLKKYSFPKVLTDIQLIIDKHENCTVGSILNDYQNINYKWLERNFKKHLGISPQSYISLRRFLRAYIDLNSSTSKDVLQIALANGYYDDNHFIKDFRRFCGMPPRRYFKSLETKL